MSGTYDFHTLSPLDFEELVRDLLQAQWKVSLESFGSGPDQGIDLRYLNGPEKVIIQAKHLLGSGMSGLLQAMKLERDKAVKLQPSRYVLATSVSLNPERKAKLIAEMQGVPLVPGDIVGQEDLNNLLRQHAEVERQQFKLWLSSTTVLERILHSGVYNRTAAEMDIIKAMVPRFVHNQSVGDAERMLAETGTLIIAGPPGVGKTTLARILLWLHAEQKWNIFVVDTLEDALKVADGSEKRLILLDDFLGQVRLSADHVRGVDARLPPLVARVAAHENLRFVLTTRDYILAQARRLSGRLAPDDVNAREYVLNVGRYTRAVKARILYNHLHFSALTPEQRDAVLANDFYLKIIDHENFNPRIIEEITKPAYLALTDQPMRATIENVLANPELLWELPYREHISQEGRAMMLALFINGRAAPIEKLRGSYVRVSRALGIPVHPANVEPSFRGTYKALEGSVLGLTHGLVMFANPGLHDFLQSVVLADKLIPLLLAEAETHDELSVLWEVFRTSNPAAGEKAQLGQAWTAALDRAEATCDRYEYIELAADLCGELGHPPLEERLRLAIDALGNTPVGASEVSKICSLLEKSWACSLAWDLEEDFRNAATRSAATLLIEDADLLAFEDIQSLDDSLHNYGNDAALAASASQEAMASLSRTIDEEVRNIGTVEELDEFEEHLLKFLQRRSYPTKQFVRDIDYRRDRLMEEGRMERPSSYFSQTRTSSSKEMSNGEIRSMFRALIQD